MKLTKDQMDELVKGLGKQAEPIFVMATKCVKCDRENGAIVSKREVRGVMYNANALILCKECFEAMQHAMQILDWPYVHERDVLKEQQRQRQQQKT